MAQVGRISGPLLTANLERNGIDLAFRNDLDTTQLLYLDVNNGLIGVNKATPAWNLDVAGTTQTVNLLTSTSLDTPSFTITDSTIRVKTGDIFLNAQEAIVMANLENGTIRISDNIISTIDSNADIDITPSGTGSTEILSNLEVFGNIHTLGNITFEGTITLGDANTDDVRFNSDITSDIIPDQTDTYSLGSSEKRWNTFYTNLINGQSINVDSITAGLIDLNARIGGIIYVAQEGNDSNVGDHPLGAVATIKEALSRAQGSGTQPFTIYISPGEYQEELPLVVPPYVSVIGKDIRNTIILPDTNSQSKDVFHLSDSTLVTNLTIKDFYYNNVNNTGYAFRFEPNAVISNRSPYIQNITVITNETSNGAGDAGRGAWIDGAELNALSPLATMLFHSCTFISPNADVINMTNGVRVEWLNSFTYYANRGLYAFNGGTGRTSEDGSTVIYGAELRSIGSANVYGTYGAVADGADTLMYLIQHNFAYIGAGADSSNNLDLVVQANEVVELNNGQIHFVSTDQVGNFRVGDNFFVNLETGDTSISIDTGNIESLSGLIINSPGGTTTIDGAYITTGSLRITGNNIISVNGLNLDSATNTLNLNDNTTVRGNLNIRDNFSFGGTLNIAGDQPGRTTVNDRLIFNVEFEQNFNPHQTLVHNLGELQRPWYNAYLDKTEVGDITIDGNVVSTDVSNADLELRANGTGEILVPSNNVQIDNNLTVSSETDLQDISVTGLISHTGDRTQTGNYEIAGEISNGNILIEDNFVTTTNSNSNLELTANGTGNIRALNDLNVVENVTIDGTTTLNNLIINGTLVLTGNTQADTLTEEYTRIYRGNSGLPATLPNEFKLNSAQNSLAIGHPIGDPINYKIGDYVAISDTDAENNFVIFQIISVANNTPTNIVFDVVLHSGIANLTTNQTYNLFISESTNFGDDFTVSGNLTTLQNLFVGVDAQFEEIRIDDNFITTTSSNADLELRANGTGEILVPINNTRISNNLFVNDIFNNANANINLQVAFNYADLTNVDITQNYITSTNLNQDLELRASNTGIISIEGNAYFANNLSVNTNTLLQDGNTTYEYGPELVINGTFDTNLNGWDQSGGGTATATGGNLRINATSAARNVSQEVTVEAGKTYDFEAQFRSVSNSNSFYLRIFESGVGTLIEWNETSGLVPDQLLTFSITPQTTAIDIIFRAVDTIVEWDNVSLFEDIGFVTQFTPVEVSATNITQTGNRIQEGNVVQTGDTVVDGALSVGNEFTKTNININSNVIRNTGEGLRIAIETNDSSSIPRIVQAIAAGATADDYVDQTDKNLINFLIDNNYADINNNGSVTTSDYLAYLQYIANGTSGNAEIDTSIASILEEIITLEYATPGYFDPILFNGDYYNPDLEFRAAGTGNVIVPEANVQVINDLYATNINATNITIDQDLNLNEIVVEGSNIEIDDNFISTTISNSNLELRAEGSLILIPTANTTVEQNLTVAGTTNVSTLSVSGTVTQIGNRNQQGNLTVIGNVTVSSTNIESDIQFDDVIFTNNIIETTLSNSDLELRANSTGIISLLESNVQIDNNLYLGTLNSSNINVVGGFEYEELNASSDIKIFNNVITTTTSNSNLELRSANNNVLLKDLNFNTDTISTSTSDINIVVNNDLNIDANKALLIPTGTTAERQLVDHSIRFNTTNNVFEAFKNNKTLTFGGVYSSNRQTSVLADPTNDTINFRVSNIAVGNVNSNGLYINGLDVDDIEIQANTIRTTLSNSDLELRGTGTLTLDDITLTNNIIRNTSDAPLIIRNTLYGKTKFTGSAIAIPAGTTAEQPVSPEIGTARWNTDEAILEVWDGSTFITAAGTSATISQEEMENLILEYTLIFG